MQGGNQYANKTKRKDLPKGTENSIRRQAGLK